MVVGPWLYHVSSALSTPPQRSWGLLHRRDNCLQINHKKCKFLCYQEMRNRFESWAEITGTKRVA